MAAPGKSRNAAEVKRRGGRSSKQPASAPPDAMLVALGHEFKALSAELFALQNDNATAFFPMAARGEELIGGTAFNPSAPRREDLGTP